MVFHAAKSTSCYTAVIRAAVCLTAVFSVLMSLAIRLLRGSDGEQNIDPRVGVAETDAALRADADLGEGAESLCNAGAVLCTNELLLSAAASHGSERRLLATSRTERLAAAVT